MEKQKVRILYVEDDKTLSFITRENLELSGYQVDAFEDGEQAWNSFNATVYDLCILDIMLPKLDGFSLARRIRKKDTQVPIIFLSAKSAVDDRLTGLRTGADDYLTKPFSMEELRLKIEVFMKRSRLHTGQRKEKPGIPIGKYILDHHNLSLRYEDHSIPLTQKEAGLLQYLALSEGKLVRREEILNSLWGNDTYFSGRSLDVFISRLRKYLKDDPEIKIENVHGIGFRFVF